MIHTGASANGGVAEAAERGAVASAPASAAVPVRKKVSLRAGHYDAAATTAHNARHWAPAVGMGAQAANDATTRMILRNRARYEVANNGYAKRMMLTLANDTIGVGPTVFISGFQNREASRKFKKRWKQWARSINLAEKLRAMRVARAVDGEAFAVFVTNPRVKGPIKLDLELVEADRVREVPVGVRSSAEDAHSEGITYDAHGNPVTYYIDDKHPGDQYAGLTQAEPYAASQVLHWFRRDRPGQRRGASEMAPCLELFAQLRRYTLAVLGAAETAADFAAVIFSDMANADVTPDEVAELDTVELEARMATTLPYGWKLGQVKAEQPTTTYGEFKAEILTEIGGAFCMPRNVATGDSSAYNYASGRLDHQPYHASIDVVRDDCEAEVMDAIFAAWADEAALVTGHLPQEARALDALEGCGWRWPGFQHVDPDKVSKANDRNLGNGTASLPGLYDEQGLDWEEESERNAEALGLTLAEYRQKLVDKLFPPAPAAPEASGGGEGDGAETEDEEVADAA